MSFNASCDYDCNVPCCPCFPLAALGCIHTRQKIVVLRRVLPSEKLNYQCSFGSINDTEKGTEVTINQTVTLSSDPSVIVFNGEMTFLSQGGAKKKKEEKKTTRDAEEVSGHSVIVRVPANTGLTYAAVSGDYNPFHLHMVTAVPFGFRQPIAHGFWTLSRVLAELDHNNSMPAPFTVHCRFLTPLFMPSEVELLYSHPLENNLSRMVRCENGVLRPAHVALPKTGIAFEVRNLRNRRPHVMGQIYPSSS